MVVFASTAYAQFTITVTVDENCNGVFMSSIGFQSPLDCGLFPDLGPGGLPAAVTYDLLSPPGLVAGDLLLFESSVPGAPIADIIRFNAFSPVTGGSGSLVFYSALDGGATLADTGFPTALYPNVAFGFGIGGAATFMYPPVQGQPGFVAGAAGPATYVVRTFPSTVPEPATVALLGAGLALVAWARRREAPARHARSSAAARA
jgi:hypothetical protein